MRKCFLIVLAITFCCTAYAQTKAWKEAADKAGSRSEKIDQLVKAVKENRNKKDFKQILETMYALSAGINNDSTLAKLNFCKAKYLQQSGNLEEAFEACRRGYSLALKSGCYDLAGDIVFTESQLYLHTEQNDSMILLLEKNRFLYTLCKDPAIVLRLKNMAAIGKDNSGDIKGAITAYRQLVAEAEAVRDTHVMLAAYTNLANVSNNDLDSTLNYLRKVIAISGDRYPARHASALYMIAFAYLQLDGVLKDSALHYLLEAEKRADDAESPIFKMNLYNAIGVYFSDKDEERIARPYYLKAYQHSSPDFAKTNMVIMNVASSYLSAQMPDSSLFYLQLAKQGIDISQDDYDYLNYYRTKAEYEKVVRKDSCALEALRDSNRSLFYARRLRHMWHGISVISSAADCYQRSPGSPEIKKLALEFLGYCDFFYKEADRENRLLDFSVFLKKFAALESLYGDDHKAVRLYKELSEILTRINDESYAKGVDELLVKYKSDLKDTEISYGKKLNTLLTAGAALLFLSVMMLLISQRRTRRFNRQISKQKEELEKLNNTQQVLFSVISHDLRKPINSLNAVVNVLGNDGDYAHKMPQYTQMLSASLDNAEGLLNNLLLWTQTQMNGYQVSRKEGDIGKLFDENIALFKKDAEAKNITVTNMLTSELAVKTDHEILRIVIRNLLSNAVKFTYKDGSIILDARHEGHKLLITVRDSGVGMSLEVTQKLFDKTNLYTTSGTNREMGTGLGLSLCYELTELLHGTITIHSEEGKGSIFGISIPVE